MPWQLDRSSCTMTVAMPASCELSPRALSYNALTASSKLAGPCFGVLLRHLPDIPYGPALKEFCNCIMEQLEDVARIPTFLLASLSFSDQAAAMTMFAQSRNAFVKMT